MPPHTPPLLATRFVALDDGTSLDLATGGRVWIERRVLDDVARAVWPEMVARLWRLWHPALAPCVDFGFVNANEWFEAYALRPPEAVSDPLERPGGQPSGIPARPSRRLRAGGARAATAIAWADADTAGTRRCPIHEAGPGPGLGMRLVPRALEGHVLDGARRPPIARAADLECGRRGWQRMAHVVASPRSRRRGCGATCPSRPACWNRPCRRDDGRRTSWLALLDGFALLVLHERAGWQMTDRQGLARLLVRLGGADSAGTVVLDVVRQRPAGRAAHTLDALRQRGTGQRPVGVARMLFAAVAAGSRHCRGGKRAARSVCRARRHTARTARRCPDRARTAPGLCRDGHGGSRGRGRFRPASWRRRGRWSHADEPRRPSGTCSARHGRARVGNAHLALRAAAGGGLAAGGGARRPAPVAALVARGGTAGAGRTDRLPDRRRRGSGRAVDSTGGAGRRRVPPARGAGRVARARFALHRRAWSRCW